MEIPIRKARLAIFVDDTEINRKHLDDIMKELSNKIKRFECPMSCSIKIEYIDIQKIFMYKADHKLE